MLAALGPVLKPAQKEARFMCGRGGGAIPRFGVAQGVRLRQQKRAERIQKIRIWGTGNGISRQRGAGCVYVGGCIVVQVPVMDRNDNAAAVPHRRK